MILRIATLILLATVCSHGQDIFSAARNNDVLMLQQYIKQHTSVDTTDRRGSTPLIIAVYNHQPEAVKLLLDAKADPNKQDLMGNTALMGVCFRGYTDMAELLIAHHTDINQVNYNGASALIFAATFGHTDIVKLLLEAGANKALTDNTGKNALQHAQLQQNEAIIALLQ
jgi:ankyrin repeat protein